MICFFFFKQKTAYEIYQCDWSSDVCSSDLTAIVRFGDWIVKEPKLGFYYPVKDEVFKRGYIQEKK